jgi:ferredoxin
MSTEIFYFSGTGNSLHVARVLQKVLPGSKLTSIISLLKKENFTVKADVVGLVFPVHGFTIPYTVKDFIQRANLEHSEYIFSVATKGGSPDQVMEELSQCLRKNGQRLSAHFSITMFTNDCMFKCPYSHGSFAPTEAMLSEMRKKIDKKVKGIADVVSKREEHLEGDEDYKYEVSPLIQNASILFLKFLGGKNIQGSFYADENCIGCGICKKVCPSDRIKIIDSRPDWNEAIYCHRCYACLNYCPSQAIQITSKWYKPSFTKEQDRYSHPFATIKEIQEQKSS